MKHTSTRVSDGIKGTVEGRKTGPNDSDQPKPFGKAGDHNQRPAHLKSTHEPPLSYSHRHGNKAEK